MTVACTGKPSLGAWPLGQSTIMSTVDPVTPDDADVTLATWPVTGVPEGPSPRSIVACWPACRRLTWSSANWTRTSGGTASDIDITGLADVIVSPGFALTETIIPAIGATIRVLFSCF